MTTSKESLLIDQLLNKSQEAFIVGVELYNKPTIRYRIEGFSFFICNAWELMLKAYIIKTSGSREIYFKDNPDRTLSLEDCLKKVMTNNKDPRRINLSRIIKLRNTSTHFITEEYEMIYIPLFQSCVLNYINKLSEYFGIDITEKLSSNFLTLSVKTDPFDETDIQAKYPKEIASRIIHSFKEISDSIANCSNENYAIPIRHDWYITKKKESASASVFITKDANAAAFILKDAKDMHKLYPYNMKKSLEIVNRRIKQERIPFRTNRSPFTFNKYHFGLFLNFYDMKSDPHYCYAYSINETNLFSYNDAALEFILSEIKKDPEHVIQKLKDNITKK